MDRLQAGRFLMVLGGGLLALQAALPSYIVAGARREWSGTYTLLDLWGHLGTESVPLFFALIPNALGFWISVCNLFRLPPRALRLYRLGLGLIVVPTTVILLITVLVLVSGLVMGWLSTTRVLEILGVSLVLAFLCWDGLTLLMRKSFAEADPVVVGLLCQALLLLFMSPLWQMWFAGRAIHRGDAEPTGAIWVAVAGWVLVLAGIWLAVRALRRQAGAGVGAPPAQGRASDRR